MQSAGAERVAVGSAALSPGYGARSGISAGSASARCGSARCSSNRYRRPASRAITTVTPPRISSRVEPAFGTNDDLPELVDAAHAAGLRVILDVVLNHAGDVFAYDLSDPLRYPATAGSPITPVDPRWDGAPYPVAGWRSATGALEPFTPAAAAGLWPDGAVFPAELHDAQTFSRRGRISELGPLAGVPGR